MSLDYLSGSSVITRSLQGEKGGPVSERGDRTMETEVGVMYYEDGD